MDTKLAAKPDKYTRFLNTYSGQHLGHSLNEVGVWLVKGEDSNCDMGGSHYQPTLGYFEGKLEDVIRYAVELPNFWQWGGGGSITKQTPPVVIKIDANSLRTRQELLDKKAALAKEMAELDAQIGVQK